MKLATTASTRGADGFYSTGDPAESGADVSTSILFRTNQRPVPGAASDTTADLLLDQIFANLSASIAEYDLGPVLYTPLSAGADVRFRQAIFRDLDRNDLHPVLDAFAEGMRGVRRLLRGIERLESRWQKRAWFLDAADRYCCTVDQLEAGLETAELESEALGGFRAFLSEWVRSTAYARLRSETAEVLEELHGVRYSMTVSGNRIVVRPYEGDADYSEQVLDTFDRFRQRDSAEASEAHRPRTYMNRVDADVLDRVARLYPQHFSALEDFCEAHPTLVHPAIALFDREIQFYVAITDFFTPLRAAGLPLCLPEVSDDDPSLEAVDVYDVALADKLVSDGRPMVLNDVRLDKGERIIVVTGANQGGKTTFARVFGQLHYLAALGAPTPGRSVRIGLCDRIFTHFERAEDLRSLSGKLEDELVRVRQIFDIATDRSVVVMNESFGSTSLRDATQLGAVTIERLIDLGARAIFVTFVDELTRLGPTVVSMVTTVELQDPSQRTFKVVRQPADGLAYAVSLAEQHGLTARQLTKRLSA